MRHVFRIFVLFLLLSVVMAHHANAQQIPLSGNTHNTDTTLNPLADTSEQPTSVSADLANIYNQRTPKKYKIASITVTGNRYFDQALLQSISTLTVGEEVVIPGGDNFAKAIQKLWSQNYFSDVEIYITRLEGDKIDIEIAVQERPRLSNFKFEGIKKGETDDLTKKSGLVKGRVITENMRRTAIDAINKYYAEKGYRGVNVSIKTKQDSSLSNSEVLTFVVDKGNKVKISDVYFIDNTITDTKLKKQLKGTKEAGRLLFIRLPIPVF